MKTFAALALVLALTACSAAPVPHETFYRLESNATAAPFATPPLPGVLEVDRVETEGVLSERAMAYLSGPGALQRFTYDLWTEAPGLLMQDQLTRALQQAHAATTIVTPDLRVPPDWILRTKLLRFELLPAESKVAVRLRVAIVSARSGKLALQQDYSAQAPTTGNTPQAAAPTMGKAVSEILTHLVEDLGRNPQ